MGDFMHALAGMAGLLALAWAMSENRRAIPWRAVACGMILLFILAVVFLKIPPVIAPYTLQGALGWLLAPLAWLAGIPWHEARATGTLLGTKTVVNELVATSIWPMQKTYPSAAACC